MTKMPNVAMQMSIAQEPINALDAVFWCRLAPRSTTERSERQTSPGQQRSDAKENRF
jgi:hypothetical protein